MTCDIPVGKSGNWEIKKFVVSEKDADFHNLRARIKGNFRTIYPGEYTALYRNGKLIMSDTPAEINDLEWPQYYMNGNCLVTGLGLGIVAEKLLQKDDVEKVTVIEISEDVIRLVGEYLKNKYNGRLEIIKADVLEYKPKKGETYDYAWHDIWDDLCSDNLLEMTKLKRKFGRRIKHEQKCWCEYEMRRLR